MNFDDYKRINAINATSLKQGNISMLHMRECMMGAEVEVTPAMRWGTLAHKCVLEHEAFLDVASVFNGDKRTKEWKEFKACHDGDFILSQNEMDKLMAMREMIKKNKVAMELIDSCVPEFTLEWTTPEYGSAKGRCDGFNIKGGILEYKTATNIDERNFGQQCVSMGYDIGCGWYIEGVMDLKLFEEIPPFTFIVQQSKPPYDVAVYYAPQQMIQLGRKNARKLAIKYRECEKDGVFPGIQADGPKELVMPAWYGEDDIMAGFLDMNVAE